MLADGSLLKKKQMTFAPNTGYAFAVGTLLESFSN